MKRLILMGTTLALTLTTFVAEVDAQRRQGRRARTADQNALIVGEMAPDFQLKSLEGESETQLSSFRGEKPVILFFGSYT